MAPTIHLVVAFATRSFGIGAGGRLPWTLPADLRRFRELTAGHTVVMGRGTWESLPAGRRPLPGRRNVVVTSRPAAGDDAAFVTADTLDAAIADDGLVFVIGGPRLFERFLPAAERVHATLVQVEGEDAPERFDAFFPTAGLEAFEIETHSEELREGGHRFRFVTYERRPRGNDERAQYLALVADVLAHGEPRPDRTGVGTLSVFGRQLRFDLSRGAVPLLTTRRVPFHGVLRELLWMLRGSTDSKALEAQGVGIWKANTSRAFLDGHGLERYAVGDLGPLYGFNLRHFGAPYRGCDADHAGEGVDQLTRLVQGLRSDPFSRRHVLTTFDPASVHACVLHPCHGLVVQFYAHAQARELSCHVCCRSSDVFLGLPFNIASYALLTHLVAALVDMRPRELVVSTGDAHLYVNHLEQARELLQPGRTPLPPPVLELDPAVNSQATVDDVHERHFSLVGYLHRAPIAAPMAV